MKNVFNKFKNQCPELNSKEIFVRATSIWKYIRTPDQVSNLLEQLVINAPIEVVKYILENCPNVKITHHETDLAAESQRADILELFIQHGAQFDQSTVEWALHLANNDVLNVILNHVKRIQRPTIQEFLDYYTRDRKFALLKIINYINYQDFVKYKINKLITNKELARYLLFKHRLAIVKRAAHHFLWKPDGVMCRKNYHENIKFLGNINDTTPTNKRTSTKITCTPN